MRLTMFTDYSLRTLMYLGLREDGLASIADIARAYAISEHHLTKVVHRLGQLGFIETLRGRSGGIRLARPAEAINVGAVVRQTEDDMTLVPCFGSTGCAIMGKCGLERVLHEALAAFITVLDKYTLADLLRPDRTGMARRLGLSDAPPPPVASSN